MQAQNSKYSQNLLSFIKGEIVSSIMFEQGLQSCESLPDDCCMVMKYKNSVGLIMKKLSFRSQDQKQTSRLDRRQLVKLPIKAQGLDRIRNRLLH